MTELCTICKGELFIYDKDFNPISCKCVLEKLLKEWLPPQFKGAKLIKDLDLDTFEGDVCYKTNKEDFARFINTYLTVWYLKGVRNYKILQASTYAEGYFESEPAKYRDADILILMFVGGYTHSKAGEFLSTLLAYRKFQNKKTAVYLEPNFNDSKIQHLYGKDTYRILQTYTQIEGEG